jgi:AcrR family transcriptional regulator
MNSVNARDDNDESRNRRSRILDSARSALVRFGFERSSMADIAAGAGVSRTTLYHYFPGKGMFFGPSSMNFTPKV